ncbi:ck1 family protein kinase [Stylonychia lemnae]|uniref:Casein kinase I n=1 Tax=Stylonychia lemnae TaxID=5949 RepID=A0A078A7U6_STYLE|nr:ck1 family protein kinase [Stylonychia lemnae]|eukprot:CDW78324.1 ck1 family protein kinase [Stylonychia lemnae]
MDRHMLLKWSDQEVWLKVPKLIDHGSVQTEDKAHSIQYLIYEYLGQSLYEYFEQLLNSTNAIQGKARMTEQLIQTMSQLHQLGFIHRDVKPDNFMVQDNEVYLIDFGCVTEFNLENFEKEKTWYPVGTPLTQSKFVMNGFYSCQGDDLISTLYSILFLQDPDSLSWVNDCINAKQLNIASLNKIRDQKEKLTANQKYCDESSKVIINQIKLLESLRVEDPDKFTKDINYNAIIEAVKLSYKIEQDAFDYNSRQSSLSIRSLDNLSLRLKQN